MKNLVLFSLVLFSSAAHAGEAICTDGLRQVFVAANQPSIVLNGFDLVGIPTGTQYDCQGVEGGTNGWFMTARHHCASVNGTGIVMQATMAAGVANVTLLNGFGFPVFSGVCTPTGR